MSGEPPNPNTISAGAIAMDFVKVFFATFAGAWSAFQIDKKHKEYKEKKQNFRAGKRAQFALISQYQSLMAVKTQHLDQKKEENTRFMTLLPFSHFSSHQLVNIDSLLFILDESDANLLNELSVANQKFQSVLGLIEARNNVHISFQGRAAKIGIDQALDNSTMAILKDFTDSLYESVDDSISTNMELFEKLREFLKKYLPKGDPLKYIPESSN